MASLSSILGRSLDAVCCCNCLFGEYPVTSEEKSQMVLDVSPEASPVQMQMISGFGNPVEVQEARPQECPSAEELKKGEFQVFVHGSGDCDNLGLGPDDRTRTKPTLVRSLPNWPIRSVACGGLHTVVLFENGTAMSWGSNDHGALGRICADAPDRTHKSEEEVLRMDCEPGFVTLPQSPKRELVRTMTCGDNHTCFLTECGCLYICGMYKDGRGNKGIISADGSMKDSLVLPERFPTEGWLNSAKIVGLASGDNHTLVLTSEGRVFRWGPDASSGVQAPLASTLWPPKELTWEGSADGRRECPMAVFASSFGSFVVLTSMNGAARVLASGLNTFGQLGVGHTKDVAKLTEVAGIDTMPIWLGGGVTMSGALMADGQVLVWGHRSKCGGLEPKAAEEELQSETVKEMTPEETQNEECGKVSITVPTQLKALPAISTLRCGQGHFLATDKDGHVHGWGDGVCGQLGNAWRDCSKPVTKEEILSVDGGGDEVCPYRLSSKHLDKRFVLLAVGSAQHSVELTWRRKVAVETDSSDDEGDFDRRRLARLNADEDDQVAEVFYIGAHNADQFWRVQVEAIYRRRNPMKLHIVPGLMEKYKGNELQLYQKVCHTYDLDPKKFYLDDAAWGFEDDPKEETESNGSASANSSPSINFGMPIEVTLPCVPLFAGEIVVETAKGTAESDDDDSDEDSSRKRKKGSEEKKARSVIKNGKNLKRSRREARGHRERSASRTEHLE